MEQTVVPAAKPIKIPGPDHPITIERNSARNRGLAGRPGRRRHARGVGRSASRLSRGSIHPAQGCRHGAPCPYRSQPLTAVQRRLQLFQHPLGGERSVNAVWSYEAPYARRHADKDYLAFYPNRVDAIEERPEANPPSGDLSGAAVSRRHLGNSQ